VVWPTIRTVSIRDCIDLMIYERRLTTVGILVHVVFTVRCTLAKRGIAIARRLSVRLSVCDVGELCSQVGIFRK